MLRAQTCHPLDPLTVAEISVAIATVRAAGATPEVINNFLKFCFPSNKNVLQTVLEKIPLCLFL